MQIENWFRTAESWFEANVMGAGALAAFGFAMLVVLGLLFLLLVFRFTGKAVTALTNASGARAARRDKSPGYRILIARPAGAGGGKAGKWLTAALDAHLAEFNFGAPYRLVRTGAIRGGLETKALSRARRRMAAADADMLVWAARTGGQADGFVLHGLSRGGGLRPDEAKPFTIALPGKFRALDGQMPRAAAYFLARELQPALANPQSFRAEKMKTLSEALAEMLEGCEALSPALRARIESDFCASGVHVAEASGDLEALERVIALRRAHLKEISSDSDPLRAIRAHMDLGRALIARAQKQYDQNTVREAMSHLSKVIEALQADPSIQRAQAASDAMHKAQNMLETRKRFAVNFGS